MYRYCNANAVNLIDMYGMQDHFPTYDEIRQKTPEEQLQAVEAYFKFRSEEESKERKREKFFEIQQKKEWNETHQCCGDQSYNPKNKECCYLKTIGKLTPLYMQSPWNGDRRLCISDMRDSKWSFVDIIGKSVSVFGAVGISLQHIPYIKDSKYAGKFFSNPWMKFAGKAAGVIGAAIAIGDIFIDDFLASHLCDSDVCVLPQPVDALMNLER